MTIGDRDRELLAQLRDMPSFVLLVSIFKHFEDDVLAELSLAKGSDEIVRITRFYQVLRAVREFMETRPQIAYDELMRLKQTFFSGHELGLGSSELQRNLELHDVDTERFGIYRKSDDMIINEEGAL